MSRIARTCASTKTCAVTTFLLLSSFVFCAEIVRADDASKHAVLTGQAAFTDAAHESPGTRRHVTVADLPAPAPEQSVNNGANVVDRPATAWDVKIPG